MKIIDLILDVKVYIAKLDEDVWYQLYLYDEEFKKYSESELGIKVFQLTFTKCIQQYGYIEYRLLKKLHRNDDLPAIIYSHGSQEWYINGKRHRDGDLPAVIHINGYQSWWKNGERHRDHDLPAVIRSNGNQEWYQHGEYHRDGDLPAIIEILNDHKYWYQNGKKYKRTWVDCHGNQHCYQY